MPEKTTKQWQYEYEVATVNNDPWRQELLDIDRKIEALTNAVGETDEGRRKLKGFVTEQLNRASMGAFVLGYERAYVDVSHKFGSRIEWAEWVAENYTGKRLAWYALGAAVGGFLVWVMVS